jgi:hypothetical protein
MADDRDTLELIGRQLVAALRPLREAVQSVDQFRLLLFQLGWNATDMPPQYAALGTAIDNAVQRMEALGDSASPQEIADFLTAVVDAIDEIQGIAVAPPGVDATEFLAEIGSRLLEFLLVRYLADEQPRVFGLLQLVHVIQMEHVEAGPARPSFVRQRLEWSEIPRVIGEPNRLPERVYGWGTPNLDVALIVDHLAHLLVSLGFAVRIERPRDRHLRGYTGAVPGRVPDSELTLVMPFYTRLGSTIYEAAFVLRHLPTVNSQPAGLVLEPRIPTVFPLNMHLTDTIDLRLRAGTNVAETFGLLIRPGGITIKYPFAPATTPPEAGVGVGFDFKPPQPQLLFGSPGATRVELLGASVDLAAEFANNEVDLVLGADLKGLALVLAAGEGDAFLRRILGDGETRVEMPLGAEWSSRHGIRFKGSAAFEVALHPHLALGPVSVDAITVRLGLPPQTPPDLRLEVGAGITGQLGPLAFFVQGMGFRADVTLSSGNLGPFDLGLGFKPPNGVGLSIDAGGFTGGGFLVLDAEKGEYTGGLELEFEGTISLRAVGILTTKLPDGREGFSLLIIIVAEFPPIQLGYGFTLLGVGGLLGLNRTTALDVLRAGLRDGSLGSVLFPHDVVANAPRIINDLKRIFPPLDGRFLIGPMGKLGWGTPTIVSVELGLLLEIPRPAFALVGVLRIALPVQEAPVLAIQVNFLGVVDFEKEQISFDASLYDSHLLTFTLTGDMAVRVYWGDNANFLLTVGGFHPSFAPPPMGLPALERLAIIIFQGNPNLRAEVYFAVTSNTVQFGARVELYAGRSVFSVYGFLALDVLFRFSPFYFMAEISAMLAVRTGSHTLFSVRLRLTLEGPTPWHAKGKASFEIGFVFTVTITVSFDVTAGEVLALILPALDVLAELALALEHPDNWRAVLPEASSLSVSLREFPTDGALVLHPFGALEISQKVVPLNLDVTRVGAQRPAAGRRFGVTAVTLGVDTSPPTAAVSEEFAPAQFLDLSDAEKLSRRSFEHYDAGVAIGGGDATRTDYVSQLDVAYEVIYVPDRQPPVRFGLGTLLFEQWALGSAVARSPLSRAQRAPSLLGAERVTLGSERFAVASTVDLTLHADDAIFATEGQAHDALRRLLAEDPGLASERQVLPLHEVETA